MKRITILILLAVVLSSCEGINESPSCHKGIIFLNESDLPICVYQLWTYHSVDTLYSFRNVSGEAVLYPRDTVFIGLVGWMDCLESTIEWAAIHPDRTDPSLRTIYICDTFEPEQNFYSEIDSVLLNHNILKEISVVDSGLAKLKACNYILRYP